MLGRVRLQVNTTLSGVSVQSSPSNIRVVLLSTPILVSVVMSPIKIEVIRGGHDDTVSKKSS